MKLAIIGSRSFKDYELLETTVNGIFQHKDITTIVSGGASGADTLAEQYACRYNIETVIHKADWSRYGKAAGPMRNKYIINDCDTLLAFWDGKSKGTLNSINTATKQNKDIIVIDV